MINDKTIAEIMEGRYEIINGEPAWNGQLIITGRKFKQAADELRGLSVKIGTLERHILIQRYICKRYKVVVEDVLFYRRFLEMSKQDH